MKKLITICVGLIVAGCATTTQLDEANAKIQDLEKRLTAIEDLNKVQREVRKSERVASEQKRSEDVESRPSEDQRNAEREAEREEQRKQLLAIQEELRRVRESKAAEMAKEDGREAEAAAKEELRRKGEAQAAAAEEAARRAEREAERERVRAELLAIQEELRRKREADVAAKEEERKRAEAEKAAKEAEEKKAVDAKIDAFLKEHLGVQFGDSIDKYPDKCPERKNKFNERLRVIPVIKKFKYFDKACGIFLYGKLDRVAFYTDIDAKYSIDSINEKMEKVFDDMAVILGVASKALKTYETNSGSASWEEKTQSSFYFRRVVDRGWSDCWWMQPPNGARRYGVSISNWRFTEQLKNEKRQADEEARIKANATGETLPDPE